jgi:cobalt/nickel transport system ATP-binding protein
VSSDGAPLLALEHLAFAYPGGPAVLAGVDLALRPGERLAIVGGVGCGKTTLLHLIVGLRRASGGRIRMFGSVCASERDFARVRPRAQLLFQDPDDQLFCPTVGEDVAFGPLNLGQPPAAAAATATRTLAALGLAGFEERVTHRLSGGEKRLVALAAVLAMDPEILLLDEPMSNLDARVREGVRHELRVLQQALGITAIHVTHDREEAMILADRIVVLEEGRIAQAGPPEELWHRPANAYVADFLGATNRLPLAGGVVMFRPEEARVLADDETLEGPVFEGTVAHCAYAGGRWRAAIRAAGAEVLVDVPRRLDSGAPVRLGIPEAAAHRFADTGQTPERHTRVAEAV